MSRVLLFVQTGDARPKVRQGRFHRAPLAERKSLFHERTEVPVRCMAIGHAVLGEWCGPWAAVHDAVRADRWWLVECENADLGRMAITTQTEQFGRILASGGRAA